MDFIFYVALLVFGFCLGAVTGTGSGYITADQISRAQLACVDNRGLVSMQMGRKIEVTCTNGAVFSLARETMR